MTKDQHSKALIEAIYAATQADIEVTFSKDFEGQMTVSVDDYHTHAGTPGGSFEQMVQAATGFINGSIGPIVAEVAERNRVGRLAPTKMVKEIQERWGV